MIIKKKHANNTKEEYEINTTTMQSDFKTIVNAKNNVCTTLTLLLIFVYTFYYTDNTQTNEYVIQNNILKFKTRLPIAPKRLRPRVGCYL